MSSATHKKIWLSSPHMGGAELEFIHKAFEDNWVAPVGPFITQFESELAGYAGLPHCAALSSGTAAIHLALITLGVGPGDEVLCSSFTFAGSCNPVVYVGAKPVFVDSERTTWNMDPALLEEAIADRKAKTGKVPRAIILVHLYGMPAAIEKICAVARRHRIPVIEDAAEALGSEYDGVKLGAFGDLGVYSFNGNKIITTSGGGALLSSSEDQVRTARFLATQARDPAPHYQHSTVGYNYRLSNISAAIGLGQLRVLDARVRQRRAVFETYQKAFANLPVEMTAEPPGSYSNRWLTTVLFSDRPAAERVRKALERVNIESRPLWKPMHAQPVFRDCPAYISGVSDDLFERGLCLPSGSNLTGEDLDRVISGVKTTLQDRVTF